MPDHAGPLDESPTSKGIADALNAQNIPAAKGGQGSATQVQRVEARAP
ncbi:hypothetical protein [Methylobacterium soli]|nr:hypothetical protein [Methylobacterium soli]